MSPPYIQLPLVTPLDKLRKSCINVVNESQRCRRKTLCAGRKTTTTEHTYLVRDLVHHWSELPDQARSRKAERLAELSVCKDCRDDIHQVRDTLMEQLQETHDRLTHHGLPKTPFNSVRNDNASQATLARQPKPALNDFAVTPPKPTAKQGNVVNLPTSQDNSLGSATVRYNQQQAPQTPFVATPTPPTPHQTPVKAPAKGASRELGTVGSSTVKQHPAEHETPAPEAGAQAEAQNQPPTPTPQRAQLSEAAGDEDTEEQSPKQDSYEAGDLALHDTANKGHGGPSIWAERLKTVALTQIIWLVLVWVLLWFL